MESFIVLGFVGILREALKIFFKNKKLMASLTLLILSLNSILFFFDVFSVNPVLTDLLSKLSLLLTTQPKTSEYFSLMAALKEDIRVYIGLEWISSLVVIVASLILSTATVIAPAIIHEGRSLLSFRELLWSTFASLRRPFVTYFYVTLLGFGYIFLVLANLLPITFLVRPVVSIVLAIIILILASLLYIYLNITWILGFVISVLEDKSGSEALGKAAKIVKGRRLQGFIFNLVFTIITVVIFIDDIFMSTKRPVFVGFFLTTVLCLVNMLWLMAYTILYYQCKKNHGEEVELPWRKGYSEVPTLIFIDRNQPHDQEEACDV